MAPGAAAQVRSVASASTATPTTASESMMSRQALAAVKGGWVGAFRIGQEVT
jgi:hypothetical protein